MMAMLTHVLQMSPLYLACTRQRLWLCSCKKSGVVLACCMPAKCILFNLPCSPFSICTGVLDRMSLYWCLEPLACALPSHTL